MKEGYKKMKIVILSFYSGEVSRGVETYVHELGNHLIDLNHQVIVYQNGPKRAASKYTTEIIGLPLNWDEHGPKLPFINYWALLVKKFTELSLQMIDKDVDVILTTNGQWQSVLVRKWTRKNTAIHVISGQSGPGLDDRINLATTPDSFVALTEYQRNWCHTAVPLIKNRIDKISNGVDIKKFSSSKDLRVDLPHPIFLNVAALEDWKGQHLAIKAVSKLKEGSLVLIGKGIAKDKLQQMGAEMLPGRFLLTELSYEEISMAYKAADVFTFPTSPWESFGIAMIEAMASGLPVVAADDPIRREIVGNAGLFVDPQNTSEYARQLSEAVEKDWGDLPTRQAKKFSWDKVAKQYEQLFERLVNK